MRTALALSLASLLATLAPVGAAPAIAAPAAAEPRDSQTVTVGPWAIATSYKGEKFDNCSMSRSDGDLGITFVRTYDGLLLLLDSGKWKLERGKAYPVHLIAGSQSVEAKALAESKSVTVTLPDRPFNARLRSSSVLQVRGEGATLRVPLKGSSAAFERLETCFDKNSREASAVNPFVAPSRKP
jgi:hypothetical protein